MSPLDRSPGEPASQRSELLWGRATDKLPVGSPEHGFSLCAVCLPFCHRLSGADRGLSQEGAWSPAMWPVCPGCRESLPGDGGQGRSGCRRAVLPGLPRGGSSTFTHFRFTRAAQEGAADTPQAQVTPDWCRRGPQRGRLSVGGAGPGLSGSPHPRLQGGQRRVQKT